MTNILEVRSYAHDQDTYHIKIPAYESYYWNGTNFRRAICDPNSYLRCVLDFMSVHGSITRLEFYRVFAPHGLDKNGRVRSGYCSYFWGSMVNAGVLSKCGRRDGYLVFVPGPKYEFYQQMADFFTMKSSKWVSVPKSDVIVRLKSKV